MTRQEAICNQSKHYNGKVCHCGSAERYLSNGACIKCQSCPTLLAVRKLRNRTWRTTIDGRATTLFHDAKRRAIRRQQVFSITIDFVKQLLHDSDNACQQTGDSLDFSPGTLDRRNPYAPSLDQIVAGMGYTKINTQIVTGWYNRMKGDLSDAEACEIIRRTKLRS